MLFSRQRRSHPSRNLTRDFLLPRKAVCHSPVVVLSPKTPVASGVYKFDTDRQAFSSLDQPTRKNGLYLQVIPHCLWSSISALVRENSAAGHDGKPWQL